MNVNGEIGKLIGQITGEDRERALQVAVYLDGELIVDTAAGLADPSAGRAADCETLFPFFSTSKGIAATAVLQGVDRGIVNLKRPLAEYWENFGCNGKEKITLIHTMSHMSALPQLPEFDTLEELCDWKTMCRKCAAETPLWEPGTRNYYHAVSFSWLACNPLCLVDGRDFNRIVREEICRRAGEELYFGVPEDKFNRLAVLESDSHPGELTVKPYDPVWSLSIPSEILPLEYWVQKPEVLKACLPASNGVGTARAVAKHYAMVMSGELLNKSTLDYALSTSHSPEPEPEMKARFGLGYHNIATGKREWGKLFGHGGYGGSNAFGDRRYNLAIAINKNRMINTAKPYPSAAEVITQKIYELLKLER